VIVTVTLRGLSLKAFAQTEAATGAKPVWHLLLGWMICIPLLFFATDGTLIPETGAVAYRATATGGGGGSVAHQLGLAIVFFICSALIVSRLPAVSSIGQRTKMLVAYPVLALLSSAWSLQPQQSIVSGVILLLFTLFALYFGVNFTPQRQFELLVMAGGMAVVLSILLAVFVPSMGSGAEGWRGIFGHKQNCAGATTLILVTGIHWRPAGFYQRAFRVLYVVMAIGLIVMSKSRTGWGLALLAMCLSGGIALLQKLRAKDALFVGLCTIPVVAALIFGGLEAAPLILSGIGKDPTLSQRTIIWAAVWKEIARHPLLGYGYKGFWTGLKGASLNVVLTSGWVLAQAQNGVLDTWVQLGVSGVVLFAVVVGQAIRNGIRCFRGTGRDSYVRWCIVVILCGLGYNVGESSLGIVSLVWFLFLLACIGLNETAHATNHLPPQSKDIQARQALSGARGPLLTGDRRALAADRARCF
jgi:exopolysaccharide production protein ExoQ